MQPTITASDIDSLCTEEDFARFDMMENIASMLGRQVAADTDSRVAQRLDELIGKWSMDDLVGRCVIQVTPDGNKTYCLDGAPFLVFAPDEFDRTGREIQAIRRCTPIRHPLDATT